VLDELLPVNFVEPGYPDVLALGIHQAVAQLFILAPHGLEHILRARHQRIGQTEEIGRLCAVAVDAGARQSRGCAVLLARELLCQSQRRELAGEAVDV